MPIKAAMSEHLQENAALAALVGDHIYIAVAPAEVTEPYIVIHKISETHERHMAAAAGLATGRFQINCYGASDNSVQAVATALREAMDHMLLTTIGTVETAEVNAAFLDGGFDVFEGPDDGSQDGTYAVKQDWIIWYEESVPVFS